MFYLMKTHRFIQCTIEHLFNTEFRSYLWKMKKNEAIIKQLLIVFFIERKCISIMT
jgi:hypothetical protein